MASPTIENMMKDFHTKLGSEKLKWLMTQFTGTKTIEDMFTFLWDFEESHQSLNPTLLPSAKSQKEAEKYLHEGDRYFKEKCLSKALEQYTFSIMHAPHPPVHSTDSDHERLKSTSSKGEFLLLATGYAKRSAVLLELEQIEEGLNDINLALANDYPDSRGDLEHRKSKYSPSNNNIVENGGILDDFKTSLKISNARRVENIPKVAEPHPTLLSLSKNVRVAYSDEKGKHIIADRDISPGEIIGVERSLSSCLEVANLPSYCSSCYKNCLAPLPCPECSMVVFCSETCRTEGLKGDHWLECRLLPTMVAMGIQPVFCTSFKLLKRYSCAQWRSNTRNQVESNKNCLAKENGPSGLNEFESVLHLVANKERRPNGDLYVKCVIAFLLVKLLQQTERYFVDSNEKPISPSRDDILFTGQLLFSHLLKISCNGFTLVEFQCAGKLSEMKKKIIGSGIFPTLCLFNHSCHPNSEPYCYGRVQVLRASRPISVGSEVTEGYCRGFYLQPKAARQRSLMNVFQFQCTCEACEGNWPTYLELPDTLQFRCIECLDAVNDIAPMCMKCFFDYERQDYEPKKQAIVDEWWNVVKKVRRAYVNSQDIASKMMAGETASKVDSGTICEAIELMEKHVAFPCQPLWDAHDALDLYFHQEREKAYGSM